MPKPITNGPTIEEHISLWMYSEHPTWSVDHLLCHPKEALRMGREICKGMDKRPTDAAIHEVCRAALNGRKRGSLRRIGA